jgi:hypothetical protein
MEETVERMRSEMARMRKRAAEMERRMREELERLRSASGGELVPYGAYRAKVVRGPARGVRVPIRKRPTR